MKIRWPRGRINGNRISGFAVKIRFNILWWAFKIGALAGTFMIHVGPLHVWLDLEYRENPTFRSPRFMRRKKKR
jgi:hypothetical protein